MCQDDRRSLLDDRLTEDLSDTYLAGVDTALIQPDQLDGPIAAVKYDDPQFLMVEIADERLEQFGCVGGTADGGSLGSRTFMQVRVDLFVELAHLGEHVVDFESLCFDLLFLPG